uniref:Uncharacterized protein n=1 Tax=Chromera velia CCMP2878 TaxID=1169474 RepID=A0A0G4F3D9_9ALVE|eukprot:Cvel_14891.t1-p1 / transcript=Cvel_14891.t1 / gene=Cvel_14891 / organism=Chromera_velia_CCMP2878 / gene_product=hypothetical protein / transcript_product=hypothetical protein / location=Cvel_scaffold1077:50863-53109(+) / protein_length=749 / sequence_SO=supercontig / SO=protein_coding / is_pseudo=false
MLELPDCFSKLVEEREERGSDEYEAAKNLCLEWFRKAPVQDFPRILELCKTHLLPHLSASPDVKSFCADIVQEFFETAQSFLEDEVLGVQDATGWKALLFDLSTQITDACSPKEVYLGWIGSANSALIKDLDLKYFALHALIRSVNRIKRIRAKFLPGAVAVILHQLESPELISPPRQTTDGASPPLSAQSRLLEETYKLCKVMFEETATPQEEDEHLVAPYTVAAFIAKVLQQHVPLFPLQVSFPSHFSPADLAKRLQQQQRDGDAERELKKSAPSPEAPAVSQEKERDSREAVNGEGSHPHPPSSSSPPKMHSSPSKLVENDRHILLATRVPLERSNDGTSAPVVPPLPETLVAPEAKRAEALIAEMVDMYASVYPKFLHSIQHIHTLDPTTDLGGAVEVTPLAVALVVFLHGVVKMLPKHFPPIVSSQQIITVRYKAVAVLLANAQAALSSGSTVVAQALTVKASALFALTSPYVWLCKQQQPEAFATLHRLTFNPKLLVLRFGETIALTPDLSESLRQSLFKHLAFLISSFDTVPSLQLCGHILRRTKIDALAAAVFGIGREVWVQFARLQNQQRPSEEQGGKEEGKEKLKEKEKEAAMSGKLLVEILAPVLTGEIRITDGCDSLVASLNFVKLLLSSPEFELFRPALLSAPLTEQGQTLQDATSKLGERVDMEMGFLKAGSVGVSGAGGRSGGANGQGGGAVGGQNAFQEMEATRLSFVAFVLSDVRKLLQTLHQPKTRSSSGG